MSENTLNTLINTAPSVQQELRNLIVTGENESIEFKRSFDREAVETLSAFANNYFWSSATNGTLGIPTGCPA